MSGVKKLKVYALSNDPIYIGTGGYTIGRVDNTIVRDTITRIPKIPGSSLAGTWRYYMALELQGWLKKNFVDFKDALDKNNTEDSWNDVKTLVNRLADNVLGEEKKSFDKRKEKFMEYAVRMNEAINSSSGDSIQNHWQLYWGNLISSIKCAGQDDKPNDDHERGGMFEKLDDTGHCGHCIICKTFGFSKKNLSQQGIGFFSDLNILLFPVYTRLGVKWITSPGVLEDAEVEVKFINRNTKAGEEGPESIWDRLRNELANYNVIMINGSAGDASQNSINLGWLNLNVKKQDVSVSIPNLPKEKHIWSSIHKNLVIVPDSLISHIINSNLEVRTSVSIDPLTGAAKSGALFTSEAIPRGTVFYGDIRLMEREGADNVSTDDIEKALDDSKRYYESLGIGGMVTRGFGRLKVYLQK